MAFGNSVHALLPSFIIDAKKKSRKGRFVVGIDGAVCAGKTFFAESLRVELQQQGETVVLLHCDDYLKPREERERGTLECEEWIYSSVLNAHLQKIILGEKKLKKPVFDYLSGTASKSEEFSIPDSSIILVEGLCALGSSTRCLLDLKILLEAGYGVRLKRWLERCPKRAKLSSARSYNLFANVSEPVFSRYFESLRGVANVLIDTSDSNAQRIEFKNKQSR